MGENVAANEKSGKHAAKRAKGDAGSTMQMPVTDPDDTSTILAGDDATVGMDPEEFALDTADLVAAADAATAAEAAAAEATILMSATEEAYPDMTEDLDDTDSAMWQVTSEEPPTALNTPDLGWEEAVPSPGVSNIAVGDTVASPVAQAAIRQEAQRAQVDDTAFAPRVAVEPDPRYEDSRYADPRYVEEPRSSWGSRIATIFLVLALAAAVAAAWFLPVSHVYVTVDDTTYDLGVNLLGFTVAAEADTSEGTALLQSANVRNARYSTSLTRLLDACEAESDEDQALRIRVTSYIALLGNQLYDQTNYLLTARGRNNVAIEAPEEDTTKEEDQVADTTVQETTDQTSAPVDETPAADESVQPAPEPEPTEQPAPEPDPAPDQPADEGTEATEATEAAA